MVVTNSSFTDASGISGKSDVKDPIGTWVTDRVDEFCSIVTRTASHLSSQYPAEADSQISGRSDADQESTGSPTENGQSGKEPVVSPQDGGAGNSHHAQGQRSRPVPAVVKRALGSKDVEKP